MFELKATYKVRRRKEKSEPPTTRFQARREREKHPVSNLESSGFYKLETTVFQLVEVLDSSLYFETRVVNAASGLVRPSRRIDPRAGAVEQFCTTIGWRYAFYAHALFTAVVFAVWLIVYTDDPHKHWVSIVRGRKLSS